MGRKVTFTGYDGADLAAKLDTPDGEPKAYALFAHCFTCTKDLKSVGYITDKLNEYGVAVLRFDFTGIGESEGDFANTDFSSNVEDLLKAAEFLAEEYESPSLLVGHSLGGAAAIRASSEIPGLKALATIAAPYSLEHLSKILISKNEDIIRDGVGKVKIADRTFTIKKRFIDNLRETDMIAAIETVPVPYLILHSTVDKISSIENAEKIFAAAKQPKSFLSIYEADHLLFKPKDAQYAATMIAEWSARFV